MLQQEKSVVIVDRDAAGRHVLAHDFGRRGYEVWAADGIYAALAICARQRPALVVSELRFADGSWDQLLAALHGRPASAPFVILTSYGSVASVVRAIRGGAVAYIVKPATADDVLAEIDEASPSPAPRWLTLDQAIWEYISRTVDAAGSLAEAARRLGVERRSLRRMLKKYSQLPQQ